MRGHKTEGFVHQRVEGSSNVWTFDGSLYEMDDGRSQLRVHRVYGDINGPWVEAVKAFITSKLHGENIEVVKNR